MHPFLSMQFDDFGQNMAKEKPQAWKWAEPGKALSNCSWNQEEEALETLFCTVHNNWQFHYYHHFKYGKIMAWKIYVNTPSLPSSSLFIMSLSLWHMHGIWQWPLVDMCVPWLTASKDTEYSILQPQELNHVYKNEFISGLSLRAFIIRAQPTTLISALWYPQ
jgi:hypothetical protein